MRLALTMSQRQPRILIERLIALGVAILVIKTWILGGFPVPFQVRGGSMAETLLGEHYSMTCTDCGREFVCDANPGPGEGRLTCSNCGCYELWLQDRAPLPGERLLIDRSAFYFRVPRRWDVVAFYHPVGDGSIAVKRIAGLPGDTVRVRDGDVYIDGQVQRKTLAQQRALRILVHDAQFPTRAEPRPPPRWHGEENLTQWAWTGTQWARPAAREGDSADWLVYSHWRRCPDGSGKVIAEPINDVCAYNQGRPRREEHVRPVRDVMLSMRLAELSGQGLLRIRASDGHEWFQAVFDVPRGRYAVLQNGRLVPGAAGRIPSPLRGALVELSLFDQQFLLALNGRTLVAWPYDRPIDSPPPPAEPFAIGVQGPQVLLQDLRVFRDVYYTQEVAGRYNSAADYGIHLGAAEYFVLGDNSQISDDSRTWTGNGAISAVSFLGRPWMVILPNRGVKLGSWQFQVPQLDRIRYIR